MFLLGRICQNWREKKLLVNASKTRQFTLDLNEKTNKSLNFSMSKVYNIKLLFDLYQPFSSVPLKWLIIF